MKKRFIKKLRTFNTKGFLVSEENYRPDDERRHLENGVAKVVYSHDENGNIISRKNFGEFEIGIQNAELRIKNEESETTGEKPVEKKEPVPVSDGNGVHEYRYTYQEYFSYDGKPILNECMYHRKDKGILIEPYGCAIKIEHYGINGKPIEDKRNVFRTNFYYTGAYQVEADRHYYSLYNRSLWVETEATIASNPFGSQTLSAYYETKKGKEVFVNKHEYKYDERNNMTLEAKYETKEGALVLVWKREYKYDERNKKTLYTDYETKEGKEIMVSKHEYKYDERNNRTLEAKYETKEGVLVLVSKQEYKYDESITLVANYETKEGALVLVRKEEYKYGKRNNGLAHLSTEILSYETKEGTLVLFRKEEYEYDERNNVTLVANYETKEGKEVLILKRNFKHDEKISRLYMHSTKRKKKRSSRYENRK
ncbi:MAG: hypothetical protein IPQ05_11885 [Leptospiraceae bacterium]|nr:hypothetical protein [Leptospiraceae bacterium]